MDEICAFVAPCLRGNLAGSHETYKVRTHAVAVKKDGNTIGLLPRIVSRVCSLSLK